jgi:hypothetical protein
MQRILAQTGILVGIGASVMVSKKMFQPRIHPWVTSRCDLVREQPAIAEILSRLAVVGDQERLNVILNVLDEVLKLASTRKKSNQWHIARLNGEIIRQAREMCKISGSVDDSTFQDVVFANDEYIPQLESLLDNVLHNHLLEL